MAKVRISPSAWIKMQALVIGHDKEVGWFGTVEKIAVGEYRIKDILIYPQLVSSAYVEDTIDESLDEMIEWKDSLSDEEYNSRRFHGHSHVNMSVSPSSTDTESWKRFATSNAAANDKRFTIAMIMNKKMEMTWWIMDAEDSIEYKNSDIVIVIEVEEGLSNSEYYEESKKLVKDIPSPKSSTYFLFGGGEKKQPLPGSYLYSKKKETKQDIYPLNNYASDMYDWDQWLDGYMSAEKKTDNEFIPKSYAVTFKPTNSSIYEIYTIYPKYYDVTCKDYFGNEYAFKDLTTAKTDDPLTAPNSVAMSIFDYCLDKKYAYFKVVDKKGVLVDMTSVSAIRLVMGLSVKSVEVKTDKEQKEMLLITLEVEAEEEK